MHPKDESFRRFNKVDVFGFHVTMASVMKIIQGNGSVKETSVDLCSPTDSYMSLFRFFHRSTFSTFPFPVAPF